MMYANNQIHYGPMVIFICLLFTLPHCHHFANLSEGWTSEKLVRYILLSVCLRLSQFSQSSFMQCMGLCVFSLPISRMIIVRICVLYLIIIIKIGSMTHLPLFRVRSRNNGICCTSFYNLIYHEKRKLSYWKWHKSIKSTIGKLVGTTASSAVLPTRVLEIHQRHLIHSRKLRPKEQKEDCGTT